MFLNKYLIVLVLLNSLNSIGLNVSDIYVKTTSGLVRGSTIQVLDQSINIFLGIPFAEPPIGELRFRKPVPLKQSAEIDGTKPGNSCVQWVDPSFVFPNFPKITQSEDCLNLNIYSPNLQNSTGLKPVMFWIHGGGLMVGSNSANDGRYLATHDVVFVAPNYRLGALGFFYGSNDSAPSNQALYDQRLALLWVKDNIHLFGGDPNQITIIGESAGSWAISAHILSPLTRNLFKRAILESGALMHHKLKNSLNISEALTQAKHAAAGLNCTDDSTWIDCLRRLDTSVIKKLRIHLQLLEGTEYLPISAQTAFETEDYNRDIDILAGVTRDEGVPIISFLFNFLDPSALQNLNQIKFKNAVTILKSNVMFGLDVENTTEFYLTNVNTNRSASLRKALNNFLGDGYITCPTYLFAKQFAHVNPIRKTYFFEFTYSHLDIAPGCNPATDGICHESELAYVFGKPLSQPNSLQIDIDFSVEIMKLWTNFAKSGNPSSVTTRTQEWPQLLSSDKLQKSSVKIKELNAYNYDRIFDDPFKRTCDGFWNSFFF